MSDAMRRLGVCGRYLFTGAVILTLLLFVLPSASAKDDARGGREPGKISERLKEKTRFAKGDDLIPVIVRTKADPSAAHLAGMARGGGHIKKQHKAVRGYAASLKASQIAALNDDPDVEHVSADEPVSAFLDVARLAVKGDVALANNAGLDGSGVGIAIIDTGARSHPDLQGTSGSPAVIQVGPTGASESLSDAHGHGTHVAGIITGSGSASSGVLAFRTFKGLAPRARVIAIRALSADGTGSTSDIIAAVDWAIQNRAAHNIRVLNLSLGHPVYESYTVDPLCLAVRAATAAGIVVVVAAGNDGGLGSGFGTISSPANEPSVITVGAMDDSNSVNLGDDVLAWYSSKGPTLMDLVAKPDIVAPGSWIASARSAGSNLDVNYHQMTLKIGDYKTDLLNGGDDGAYFSMAGTSMAAPMVAATAALMIQKDPSLTPATVKARLMISATKDTRLVFETGAGHLDVNAAVSETSSAASGLSPRVMSAADGGVYIEETAETWGGRWSLTALYGSAKGSAAGFSLTSVDSSVTQTYGAIWGGKGGALSIIDNDQVTGSGEIWSGQAFSVLAADQTVDKLGAIWGGGGRL